MTLFLSCFLLGCLTGLRSLTAPATICWAAHFGWLNVAGSKLAFINRPVFLVVMTALALGELIADKLPRTPARTAPLGLIARITFGAFCGVAIAASAGGNLLTAATVAVVGALIGMFGVTMPAMPSWCGHTAGFPCCASRRLDCSCRKLADRVTHLEWCFLHRGYGSDRAPGYPPPAVLIIAALESSGVSNLEQ